MSDIDLLMAESAYATLLDAMHKQRNIAADLVRPLRTETQNDGARSHEIEIAQADAWLAICSRDRDKVASESLPHLPALI
jgi:hypothetical protein